VTGIFDPGHPARNGPWGVPSGPRGDILGGDDAAEKMREIIAEGLGEGTPLLTLVVEATDDGTARMALGGTVKPEGVPRFLRLIAEEYERRLHATNN
jgi:hypothetical protein